MERKLLVYRLIINQKLRLKEFKEEVVKYTKHMALMKRENKLLDQ
jgi:hypothetical protein